MTLNGRTALCLMAVLSTVNLIMIYAKAPIWMFVISIGISALMVCIGFHGLIKELIGCKKRHTQRYDD